MPTANSLPQPMNRPIEGILFDMDGTLLETEPLGCHAVYYTLKDQMSPAVQHEFEERNLLMPWDLKQKTLGLPGPQWSPIVLEWAQQHWGVENPPSVDQFLNRWDSVMYELLQDVKACKGANELVQQLASHSKKLPLAIATSSHAKSVERKRVHHEASIFQHMNVIVAGDDPAIVKGKPAPDIYLEAAKRLQVNPKNCIVFEDGMPGVQAGKAAGCFVVAVPDPRFSAAERMVFEKEADLVLEDLSQLDVSLLFQEQQ